MYATAEGIYHRRGQRHASDFAEEKKKKKEEEEEDRRGWMMMDADVD